MRISYYRWDVRRIHSETQKVRLYGSLIKTVCGDEIPDREWYCTIDIHRRMSNVYGEESADRSTVMGWVRGSRKENAVLLNVNDEPHFEWPKTAVSVEYRERIIELVHDKRRFKPMVIASIVGIPLGTVNNIVKGEHFFTNVCYDGCLAVDSEIESIEISNLSADFGTLRSRGRYFLHRIVNGDEIRTHHYDSKTKRQSIEFRRISSFVQINSRYSHQLAKLWSPSFVTVKVSFTLTFLNMGQVSTHPATCRHCRNCVLICEVFVREIMRTFYTRMLALTQVWRQM